ncbi:MAG: CpaF family protein [Candidatus Gastranaerophilales bacterium]|nr:CpaF family protein [Candidatus Gastranaerophilales bacterium]
MSLKDRLNTKSQIMPKIEAETTMAHAATGDFLNLKEQLHVLLVEKVNSTPTWINYDDEQQKELIKQFVESQLINNFKNVPLNKFEKDRLIKEIIQEAKGYGPLDPLLEDPTISDILVNGAKDVFVEKNGKLYKTNVTFKDNQHLRNIIERIVSKVGRRIDEKSPMVDARLADGSRVNAIIPPLAIDGPSLSIRKFKQDAGNLESLLKWGTLSNEIAQTLSMAVKAKLNIVISGGTGAGKTTLLNSLSSQIPNDERIITIEDSAELSLQQEHIVRLETRIANIEGTGQIAARDLVINALRMRPDRIIVGECRGAETLDMLQAMNTGHDGSLTTLHANSPRDALSRLETMAMYSGIDLPEKNIKSQIASAVNLIIQISRMQDGTRKITSISEITGMEGNVISMQEIFVFEQTGFENSKVQGHHVSTGIRPKFVDKLKEKSLSIPLEYFNKERKHTYINGANADIKLTEQSSVIKSRLINRNDNIFNQRLQK